MAALELELAEAANAAKHAEIGKCMEVPLRVQEIRMPGREPFNAGRARRDKQHKDLTPDGNGEEILLQVSPFTRNCLFRRQSDVTSAQWVVAHAFRPCQGFNWDSHHQDWYGILRGQVYLSRHLLLHWVNLPVVTNRKVTALLCVCVLAGSGVQGGRVQHDMDAPSDGLCVARGIHAQGPIQPQLQIWLGAPAPRVRQCAARSRPQGEALVALCRCVAAGNSQMPLLFASLFSV
eukprot:scaffold348242_cov35-Prasinocladus_malaysianus.AAC.1